MTLDIERTDGTSDHILQRQPINDVLGLCDRYSFPVEMSRPYHRYSMDQGRFRRRLCCDTGVSLVRPRGCHLQFDLCHIGEAEFGEYNA